MGSDSGRSTEAKAAVRRRVEAVGRHLIELSHRIHANPELSFEEEHAARWVADALLDAGFSVQRGICELPTAFVATAGHGPLTVAVCAEYDALPDIGHACGHNVIAAIAVGTGVALAPLVDDLGLTVKVFGTPAEETGGGKILMLQRGAFTGVHAAMMVHPAPFESAVMPCLALAQLDVEYTGKDAHASAFPESGINAADALTVAQTAIGLLRQHVGSSARIHGIVTKGGDAPNVVPAHTRGTWFVREKTLARLADLEPRVRRCFEAGAVATGCSVRVDQPMPPCSEFHDDLEIAELYRRNAEALGRRFSDPADVEALTGSTDMANVSLAVPAIHPLLSLGCHPVVNHQAEFAAVCASPVADRAVIDGAMALGGTIVDLALHTDVRGRLLAAVH